MKKNILVQMLATILIPTGLYAFYRIDKLRMGMVMYGISFAIAVASSMLELFSDGDIIYMTFSAIFAVLSLIVPMLFIREWTIQYNNKIKIVS